MEGHRWTYFLPSVNSDNVKIDVYIWTFVYLALIKNTSTYLIEVTCLTTRGKRLRCLLRGGTFVCFRQQERGTKIGADQDGSIHW